MSASTTRPPPAPPTPLDCAFANLTYHAAITLFPSQAQNVDDALRGYTSFGHGCSFASGHAPPHVVSPRAASRHSRLAIYVTSDAVHARADGTAANPFASLAHALDWRRRHKLPHDIVLNAGMHYLTSTVVLNSSDSGLSIVGEPGAWLSGGVPLPGTLQWTRADDGRGDADTNTCDEL